MAFQKSNQELKHTGLKFKKSMLAMCIMAVGAPSFAQTETTKASEAVEEILITGQRANLESSQEIKRQATTFVDAISATDIGALPDKSVLESLQRVPGVSIERFAAATDPDHFSIEGSGVTLRGLPQTRSEFNGRDSFSANSGRGLSFSDVPPELMSKVEVFKSMSANMIEGGISGTINLSTRKPFDSADQLAAFTVTADYADLSKETEPSFSGLYSNQWSTGAGDFGFLISLANSKLTTRTDALGYGAVELATFPNGPYTPINAAFGTTIQERERNGGSLVGQWRNQEATLVSTLEYVRSDTQKIWAEHVFSSDDSVRQSVANSVYKNNAFVSGTLEDSNPYQTSTRKNDQRSLVEDLSFNVKFTPSDELTVTADLQYIKAKTDNLDLSLFGGIKASSKVNFGGDDPTVLMIAPTDAAQDSAEYFADPKNYYWRGAMDHIEDNKGDEKAAKLDFKYELDQGWAQSIEAGVRFSDRDQTTQYSKYNWGNLSESWRGAPYGKKDFAGNGGTYSAPPYDVLEVDEIFGSKRNGAEGGVFLVPSEILVRDYQTFLNASLPFNAGTTEQFQGAAGRKGTVNNGLYLRNEINEISETNQAIYAQLNFGNEEETINGNLGLRVVRVETESVGGITNPNPLNSSFEKNYPALYNFTQFASPEGPNFTATNSTTSALPSLNIKYSVNEEVQTRFAVSKAISYPDLGNLRNYSAYDVIPSGVVTDINGDVAPGANIDIRGSKGNPNLKPMESINYDASVEWYFAKGGSIFAGLFYKDISSFFASESVAESYSNNGVTVISTMEQPVNKGDSSVTGFEMGYQQFYDMLPAPFDGLGLQLNLTLLDQSGTAPNSNLDSSTPPNPDGTSNNLPSKFTDLPLQGLSDTTYNIVALYEKGDISTRIAYNWRSDYLLTTADVITKLPIYSEASGQVDASAFYTISDNFKIGVEGSNLLNEVTETKMQVNQDKTKVPRRFFINDRRVSLVLKGTF